MQLMLTVEGATALEDLITEALSQLDGLIAVNRPDSAVQWLERKHMVLNRIMQQIAAQRFSQTG